MIVRSRKLCALLALTLALPLVAAVSPAAGAPAAPTLTSPSDGAVVTANPVLTWDPVSGAVKYQVTVATDVSFASGIKYQVSTANTSATPPTDLPVMEQPYYWRVVAFDAANATAASSAHSFVKAAANAPVLANSSAVFDYPHQPVVLSWAPMAGVASYEVEVDTDSDFIGAALVKTTNTSYTPTDPKFGAFVWRVRGKSAQNVATNWSETGGFTVQWTARPTLISPVDTNLPTIEEIVLDWTPMTGAANYRIQIDGDELFNSPDVNTTVAATQYAPPNTLENGDYYWRVQGLSTGSAPQPSEWSEPWQFTRAWPAGGAQTHPRGATNAFSQVTLIAPADGASNLTEPTFSWTPQREAAEYEFWIGDDPNFSPNTYDVCTTNRTVFTPSTTIQNLDFSTKGPSHCNPSRLNPGATHYWRVRAIDNPSDIQGVFSEVRSFLYDPVTELINQTAPISGQTGVNVPILRWDPVPNIARYKVSIDPTDDSDCANVTAFTYSTVLVPDKLNPACTGAIRWFVQAVEPDGQLSRNLPLGSWKTFTLGTYPAAGESMDPVTSTAIDPYRPPLMRWTPSNVATVKKYRVFAAVAGFDSFVPMHEWTYWPAFAYAGENTSLAPLLPPNDYDFYVASLTDAAAEVGASGTYTFTVGPLRDAGGQSETVLVAPANCLPASCTDEELLFDTPTFDWEPVRGAGSYILRLATDPNFTNNIRSWTTQFSELTPQESLPDSQAGQAYYWFVIPCFRPNACGKFDQSVFGQAFAFRKKSPAVQPVSPAPGAVVNNEVTFTWTDYLATNVTLPDATQEARNYRVQISTTADFTGLIDTGAPLVDQTTYTPQVQTLPDGPLWWRVQAFDNSNNALSFSPGISFTKTSTRPTLLTPAANDSTSGAPVLTWSALAHTNIYLLEIYKNPQAAISDTNRVVNVATRSAAYQPTVGLPAGTYGWRVARRDINSRQGPFTEFSPSQPLRTFTVGGPAATLIAPADLATIATNSIVLQWTAVAGAARYRVEVSTSQAFTSLLEAVTTDMTSWAPGLLSPTWPNATIYWRVKTLDASGTAIATSQPRRINRDVGTAGEFTSIAPVRVLDTRRTGGAIGANANRLVPVTGTISKTPSSGISAVVINVTATGPTLPSYLTIYPADVTRPTASNLNFVAKQTVANLVTVGVDSVGRVRIFNAAGATHVVVDLVGYYSNGALPRGSRYVAATTPTRIVDTNNTIPKTPLGSNESRVFQIAGKAGVPEDGVAVVMSVTAVSPTLPGYLTLYPAGAGRPTASNMNFLAGQTISNMVVVRMGVGGDVAVYNPAGQTHLRLDVLGWYELDDPPHGGRLNPVTPARIFDSRLTADAPKFTAGQTRTIQVRDAGGVPNSVDATSVVINVTVTQPTAAGEIRVFASDVAGTPTVTNVRYAANQTIPTLVSARLGPDGKVKVYSSASAHVIVDVVAWFKG